MFKVDIKNKKLIKMSDAKFQDIGCKERNDLQEWIVNNPEILMEELLIIQKEFDGFGGTNERLDLLALDKNSKLVVIENKTNDTGRDVVWQSIKYASYVSTLSAQQVTDIYQAYINRYQPSMNLNAETAIRDFLGKEVEINPSNSQRIMMVAGKFRAEVLSAAQWLISYGIDITCVKVSLLTLNSDVYIDSDVILPQPDTKEYSIKLAKKEKEAQEQQKVISKGKELCYAFWNRFQQKINNKSTLFSSITFERYDNWLGVAAGMLSGIGYNFLICKEYCGVELCITNNNKTINKKVFDLLYSKKAEIENGLNGYELIWNRQDENIKSQILVRNTNLSLYNEDSWAQIEDYLCELMIRFEATFKKYAALIKAVK